MLKVTVLLDVDETCAISNQLYNQQDGGYRYNDALFAALKQCQCTEIYLFTSYNLASISLVLEDESVGAPSRLKLIQYLESQGFRVQGVLTPLDVVFKQGIGAYYEQVIKPYEMRVLSGENLRIGSGLAAYQAAIKEEMNLVKEAYELKMQDKGSLYQYFIQVQRDALLYPHFNVFFVDDKKTYLENVNTINQQYGYPLCLVQAKPQDTVFDYQKRLCDFQHSLEVGYITKQLEQIKAFTLGTTQDNTYQLLQKEFQLVVANSDLLSVRSLAMKVTFFLTELEKRTVVFNGPSILLDNPLLQDKQADRLLSAIKALPGIVELSDGSEPDAILYGLEKPYAVSLETARKMLNKINKTGLSNVGLVGNIFFKQGPEHHLVEQAIYQMSRLFREGIVTPTRLLLLKIGDESIVTLQASLGVGLNSDIDAIDLDALFQIPELISMLQEKNEVQFIQNFETLLSEFSSNMPWEKQLSEFVEILLKLEIDYWPLELKDYYDQPEPRKSQQLHADLAMLFKNKTAFLRILALLQHYPILSKKPLNDLIAYSNVFESLRFLYPNLPPVAVLKEAQLLLSYIAKENLSAHLLLEMVSEPDDHKGDNFKVQFRRNGNGNLMPPLEIIAIDNDSAMTNVFSSFKGKHEVFVKSLLLANRMLLNQSIAEPVREQYLLMNPKVAVMYWLEALNHYYEPYYALKESGIIIEPKMRLNLVEQLPLNFIKRLLERLTIMHNSLQQGAMTHKALWLQVEPLLAYSYDALSQTYLSSVALMNVLYGRDNKPPLLNNILKEHLAQPIDGGKTLGELMAALPDTSKKQQSYRFYIEVLTEQIVASLDVQDPLQVHALTLCMRLKRFDITLSAEGLIMSTGSLIKAYTQEPQQWINLISNCEKVSIQFQTLISFNNPLILFYALAKPEGPLLVEALLAAGAPANQVRPQDGLTPLHFAASFYPDAIPALIANGAESECLVQGMTALEMAIHTNQYKAITLLLQAGAGRDLKASVGLDFIKAYQKICPELCQALLSRNIAMAWYLALETVSQDTETRERVSIMGIEGKRYLRSEIYHEIFKQGHAFPKDNVHGVRSVTSIKCKIAEGIDAGLHLKEYPELPGREMMVHILAKHLFGFITPSIALWRFSRTTKFLKKEVAYPVLASRSIEGKNLFDVMQQEPEQLKKLDKQSVYEAIILAMLINPEDGRADNYIIQPFSCGRETRYRLVSIDNDHAFVRPIGLKKSGAELAGTKSLQVKTILYCLEEMLDPLPSEMVVQLLADLPYKFLKRWLMELGQLQIEIDMLFNQNEKNELFKSKDIHLDIAFRFSIVEDIYHKFCRLQTVLREDPRTPLFGLLKVVIPELWIRYVETFSKYPTPLERFNVLTKDSFEMRVVKKDGETHLYPGSTASASQVFKMTGKLEEEEKAWKEEQESSSQTALLRLDQLYAECNDIKAIALELQEGKVERFKKLPPIYQEKIVNGDESLPGIDFNAMLILKKTDIRRQQAVLAALYNIPFRTLKIRKFSALTDRQLGALLQGNKSLLALSLEGCLDLSNAASNIIVSCCPNLEKLLINKVSWSRVNLSLPHLRVLYVQECTQLLSWELGASSKLERLYFKNCERLNNLSINSVALREIKLQYCPKLSDAVLLKLTTDSNLLKKVELIGCSALLNAHFYQQYPKLLNLPLQDFSSEFVEQLDEGMALSLKAVGMSVAMIQPAMIEKLQENLILWQRFRRTQFFPLLLKLLKDKHLDVRKHVCETLSKLPLTVEDRWVVLPALLEALEDTYSDVRKCAVQALSKLLSLTTKDINRVLPILLKAMGDKRTVKIGVCEAVPNLSLKPEDILILLSSLLKLLEDEYADVRSSAAEALSRLSLSSDHVAILLPVLLKIVADENEEVRHRVCNVLSKLPLTAEDMNRVLPLLLKQLGDKNELMRSGVCEALSKLPLTLEFIDTVLPALLKSLLDEQAEVRSHACEALSNLPLRAEDLQIVLQPLLRILEDPESDVRRDACAALSKLPLTDKDKSKVILPLTKVLEEDKQAYVRKSAQKALLKLSLKPENTNAILPDLKTDKDLNTSSIVEAMHSLTLTNDDKKKQLLELLEVLTRQNETINGRNIAARTLLSLPLTIEDKILIVLPTLLNFLENQNPDIRIQTVGFLVEFYPLTQEIVSACCQKFKKAVIAPAITQSADTKLTHEIAVIQRNSIYQKESVLNVPLHSGQQRMNVSGQGNNCGLFALIIGIKKGLENKPQLRGTTRLPDFFDAIDNASLKPGLDGAETIAIGVKLRAEMATALLNDVQYKARRYYNLVAACRAFLEGELFVSDMQAWLAVTRDYRDILRKDWIPMSDSLEKSYSTVEVLYHTLLDSHPINFDDIVQLKEALNKQIMDKPDQKVLNELLESYYKVDNGLLLGLIQLRRLYRAAWVDVTAGTGIERNVVSDIVETIFKQKALVILQQQDASTAHQNLLLLSLLEKTNFDQHGALVGKGITSREEVFSAATVLFVENDLGIEWDTIYQNYAEHIKVTTAMLSADELGCLAQYWNIQLKIQFAYGEAYTTNESINAEQLQVVLCNPTYTHWNVVCDMGIQFDMKWDNSKIVGLILSIENMEYKSCIIEAINHEHAYAQRYADCSYVAGVLSAIQEMPHVLLRQGVFLSAADRLASQELSQYVEQGLLVLNAERIYFLKSFLTKNIFESLALGSVVEQEESFAPQNLFFDFNSPYGKTRDPRVSTQIILSSNHKR